MSQHWVGVTVLLAWQLKALLCLCVCVLCVCCVCLCLHARTRTCVVVYNILCVCNAFNYTHGFFIWLQMSKLVIQCLQYHRKPGCKYGLITNSEDFKHLARKVRQCICVVSLCSMYICTYLCSVYVCTYLCSVTLSLNTNTYILSDCRC